MSVDDATRFELHEGLREALGDERADTLMSLLPPVGWADVATKRDLDTLAAATKKDLDTFAAITKRDLDTLAKTTKQDLDTLAKTTKKDLDTLAERLEKQFHQEMNRQIWALLGFLTAAAALLTANNIL